MMQSFREIVQFRPLSMRPLWILLLSFSVALPLSIALAQTFLAAATIYYFYWKIRYDSRFPRLPLFLPLGVFIACQLFSVLFSLHPFLSFLHLKYLAPFILIPLFYEVVRSEKDILVIHGALLASGLISSMLGIYQFFTVNGELLTHRITGFLGHWMTFSGVLMFLTVLTLSYLLLAKHKPIFIYALFCIFGFTLLLSLTRSAWVGIALGSFFLLVMKKAEWGIAVPVAALIIFAVSIWILPPVVSERIVDTFSTSEASNHTRLEMLKVGAKMIQQHPFTGVGGGMIPFLYLQYRSPSSIPLARSHLHNNFVQIAAEYGLFTLAAWIWLIARILLDLTIQARRLENENKMFAYGAIAIVISMLVAGLFEYNFGDSEVRMALVVLVTLPLSLQKKQSNAAQTSLKAGVPRIDYGVAI